MKYTVQDLINTLETIEDKTKVISLEGCDCCGLWIGKTEEYRDAGGFDVLLLNRYNDR